MPGSGVATTPPLTELKVKLPGDVIVVGNAEMVRDRRVLREQGEGEHSVAAGRDRAPVRGEAANSAGKRASGGVQPTSGDVPGKADWGWSTTRTGGYYNGRDHSMVCYSAQRIEALREMNPEVDGLLTALAEEIRSVAPTKREGSIRLMAAPADNGRLSEEEA
jgi:hypothetical protein